MKKNGIEKSNAVSITILGLILLIPIVIEFIYVTFRQYGLGNSSIITMMIYGAILIYAMVRTRYFKKKDFALLIGVYTIFAFNYIFFEETRNYIVSTEMMIQYIFFLPIGILIIKNIRDWRKFEAIVYPFAAGGVLIAFAMVITLNYKDYLSYMEFSYALLPLICILYNNFRYRVKRRAFPMLLFLLGTIEIIIFSSRAPLLYLIIYICLFEIFRVDISKKKKIILIGILGAFYFILIIFSKAIITYLSAFPIFKESRIFSKILSGKFFISSTRNAIYESCILRIKTMGLSISGLFGDRAYCGNDFYPHNFIYEILMSYGWILGAIILIGIAMLIVRCFVAKEENRIIALFFLLSIFSRYMVSGSYLIEGKFWIFLFAMISLSESGRTKEEKKNYEGTYYIS